jgi:hypothetical protein
MEERNYSVVVETECPVSRDSVINWLGFSEEGQFMTLDTEGVLRAFNFRNHQWIPCLDFKSMKNDMYNRVWIAGVTDSEVLAIEMNSEQTVPILAQRSQIRRFKLRAPLLNQETNLNADKEQSMAQIEEQLMSTSLVLDHSQFRKDTWEPLKHFRSKYDSEHCLSESVPDAAELARQKKNIDKYCLNAIRLSIINQQHEKVFSFMDGMHFNQSLKLVVRLCEQLKVPALANKVQKYLQDKETKEIFGQQMQKQEKPYSTAAPSSAVLNSQLGSANL